ncbi:MAG: lysylphosphatidylglycerol synthase transmembrane domain-containing protein [Eubacteriales bacterium]|nr:lysylphosphatidylglycerol synthase transmembrane domain-containing protein [Eubacteriales bacterium]
MKGFLKRYGGVLFILLTIAIVVLFAMREGNWADTVAALRSMDWRWELLAGLFWLAFVGSRAYTMKFYLARQGVQVRFGAAFHASIIGLFYSGVTPAASGGQPMQMYHLHKEGVPVSLSASGVLVKFVGFQSMLLLLAGLFLGLHYDFVRETVGSSYFLVALGFAINAVVVAAVLLLLISRRAVRAIMRLTMRVGERLRLIKDRPTLERRVSRQVEGYLQAMATVRDRPLDMLAMFALSALQVASYSCIIWALYHAFGLSGASFFQLVTIQLLLYQTVSFVPLPGASGAQEGLFFLMLHVVVPESCRVGMLFSWRFFTFYLTMLVGGLTIVLDGVRSLRRRP